MFNAPYSVNVRTIEDFAGYAVFDKDGQPWRSADGGSPLWPDFDSAQRKAAQLNDAAARAA